jgi:TatD DNase family protein
MCGVHPQDIPQTEEELWTTISEIKELVLQNEKVVAIGEIGLDYYWKNDNKELQIKAFEKQIDLANELKLPIAIHTREAIDDTIAIIRKKKIEKQGVLHCCPFNPELVRHGLEAGLYIAFGGTSTFKNSKNVKQIVEMVPLDRMLIETDSPYLAPEPVRGTRNDSSNLKYIVQKLAELKNITPEQMAKTTYQNAEKLFLK